jgi:ribosomal protein L19E
VEGLDVQLVEDGVLVPERVAHGLPRGRVRVRNEARRAGRREGGCSRIARPGRCRKRALLCLLQKLSLGELYLHALRDSLRIGLLTLMIDVPSVGAHPVR